MKLGRIGIGLGTIAIVAIGASLSVRRQGDAGTRLVTGKYISPVGDQVEVGSFPVNIKLSPDGRFIAVSDCGFREQLSILDSETGKLVSKEVFASTRRAPNGMYFGLDFQNLDGKTFLYVSRGAMDSVLRYTLDSAGKLSDPTNITVNKGKKPKQARHFAGLAVNGQSIYAVCNRTYAEGKTNGSIATLDSTGVVSDEIQVGGYPFDIVLAKSLGKSGKLFVSNERDGTVTIIDVATKETKTLSTGANPAGLTKSPDESKIYASNSGSDTISVIDTRTERVTQTIYLRIGDLGGIPGASPLGMTASPDGKWLYVAMYDINAVAVVDTTRGQLKGFIPAGWGPTAVAITKNGTKLYVANAKGVQAQNPNNKPVRTWGQYHPNILEGTVGAIDLSSAMNSLESSTKLVLTNNLASGHVLQQNQKKFVNPGIDHVVYIIKENRTYDQILGDDKRGNGDPSICLFPASVTPNQHALADRFLLLDNFYVCAEVSYDGWAWSTQGIANPYVERNVVYNYSGRGGSYDSEGENGGEPVDLIGQKDVARTPNGYIWEQCAKQNISYMNYGFFLNGGGKDLVTGKDVVGKNQPNRKSLVGKSNTDFLQFDTSYADSDAWVKYGLAPAPQQMPTFGSRKDPSRASVWLRDFKEQVAKHDLPRLTMLRLMRDHTAGTSAGQSSPRAMVADNDYAVGQVVEAISHSPYWKNTVICVLEDDAQAGFDHVDCHRSTAYLISLWLEKGTTSSQFYNTDSMLRTIELILGLKPLNQYDAVASPINLFSKRSTNDAPFDAILPAKSIIAEVNDENAYRAKDSKKLIARNREDSAPDIELNDILWGAIKGAKTPRPMMKGAQWKALDRDSD